MLAPKQEKLEVTINDIFDKKILLPDFQRKFIWTDEEMQKNLVASVLAKMPIGSILLLKAGNATEYACKLLGSKKTIDLNALPEGEVNFLLDGQQRMTVLTNVFSDVVFQANKQVSNLIAQNSLKRRFFLTLPKYHKDDIDLFGIKRLDFPVQSINANDPNFLTSDICPYISVINFNANTDSDKCFFPYNTKTSRYAELKNFCMTVNDDWYYIPLYLLVNDKINTINNQTLTSILEKVANDVRDIKFDTLYVNINNWTLDDIEKFIKENVTKEYLNIYFDVPINTIKHDDILIKFKDALDDQSSNWKNKMYSYLISCVNEINLNQIVLEQSQRARAIDIYENLNRGGVSLSVFDLIMARVAQVSTTPFYERLETYIEEGFDYSNFEDLICTNIVKKDFLKLNSRNKYRAAKSLCCYDANKDNFNSNYLHSFLNVLTILSNKPLLDRDEYSIELIKRNKKLELGANEINNNCEVSCKGIDRACFFLQSRCGIRKIGEVNYTLMLTVLGYILSFDNIILSPNRKIIFDLLEGWYWASIFSGAYDKDQNQVMIQDLNNLIKNILDIEENIKPDLTWVDKRKNDVLQCKGFSNLDFLLLKDVDSYGYPKAVLSNAICQYYLSKGYEDLLLDADGNKVYITPFASVVNSLQIHHVIPLGSSNNVSESTKELRKRKSHF